jgi:O-antigen ligase/tetratricopeptide (TPR) repeat protein
VSRSSRPAQSLLAAAVVHDVALLIAVFYAPILWGGVAIPEIHSAGTLSASAGQTFVASFVGIAAVAALVARWLQGRGPAVLPNAVNLPAAVLLAISALSALFSVSRHASALELARLTVGVLLFWLVANRSLLPATPANLVAASFGCSAIFTPLIPMPGDAGVALKLFAIVALAATCAIIVARREDTDPTRWLLVALVLSAAIVVALYGLREKVEVFRQLDNPSWQIFSTFFNPNPLGGFLAMMFPLAFSLTLAAVALWQWLLWEFCAVLLALAILPTYSKGAMLAFVVAMACYGIFMAWQSAAARRVLRWALAVVVLGALTLGVATWQATAVRSRLTSALGAQQASNMFRILTWQGTVRVAAAHPWIGVGPSGFQYIYPKYAIAGYVGSAHQNYLQMFAELGVAGGVTFLWLLGAVLFTGNRALRAAKDFPKRALAIACLCTLIAFLVHSFLEYDWYIGAIGVTFWLVAGVLAHQALGRPVLALPSSDGKPRARRRRTRTDTQPAPPQFPEARDLPWPGSTGGRTAAVLVVALVLSACAWRPARNALAQQALNRGDDTFMSGSARGVARHYEKATEYDPDWARAWERFGLILGFTGSVPDSAEGEDASQDLIQQGERAIKRAIELEPTNHGPRVSLARLYEETGRMDEAVQRYREALELFPNHTKTLLRLADAYRKLGQEEDALHTYRRLAALEDSPANAYRALAGVDIDTNYGFVHYQLGRVAVQDYDDSGDRASLETALSEFNAALRVVRDYFTTAEPTDKMFRMLHRPREVRTEDMKKLEAQLRWRLAQVHERLGEREQAVEERSAARVIWPQVAEAVAAEDEGEAE